MMSTLTSLACFEMHPGKILEISRTTLCLAHESDVLSGL